VSRVRFATARRSPPPAPSAASPGPPSARRTPAASGTRSPRCSRSCGSHPPALMRPARQPAAAWRRSRPACVSSAPFPSSSGLKPYLRTDHFAGGRITRARNAAVVGRGALICSPDPSPGRGRSGGSYSLAARSHSAPHATQGSRRGEWRSASPPLASVRSASSKRAEAFARWP
jgi:hypothetical protein